MVPHFAILYDDFLVNLQSLTFCTVKKWSSNVVISLPLLYGPWFICIYFLDFVFQFIIQIFFLFSMFSHATLGLYKKLLHRAPKALDRQSPCTVLVLYYCKPQFLCFSFCLCLLLSLSLSLFYFLPYVVNMQVGAVCPAKGGCEN